MPRRLAAGQRTEALAALLPFAWNRKMEDALAGIVEQCGRPDAEARIAKRLAEYDYLSLRRLERTRILVRMGPALGLMGTLIPLSPALAGLADGDVETLTENLRVAFSVTVAGLMIGAFAFAISLVRDRLYAQDYSDVEYVAASLTARRQRLPAGRTATGRWRREGHPARPQPRRPRRRPARRPRQPLRPRHRPLRRLPPRRPLLARPDRGDHRQKRRQTENTRPADAVVADKDQKVKQVELQPDEKVVGRGEPIGTVYQLSDGRTVIVREALSQSGAVVPTDTQTAAGRSPAGHDRPASR